MKNGDIVRIVSGAGDMKHLVGKTGVVVRADFGMYIRVRVLGETNPTSGDEVWLLTEEEIETFTFAAGDTVKLSIEGTPEIHGKTGVIRRFYAPYWGVEVVGVPSPLKHKLWLICPDEMTKVVPVVPTGKDWTGKRVRVKTPMYSKVDGRVGTVTGRYGAQFWAVNVPGCSNPIGEDWKLYENQLEEMAPPLFNGPTVVEYCGTVMTELKDRRGVYLGDGEADQCYVYFPGLPEKTLFRTSVRRAPVVWARKGDKVREVVDTRGDDLYILSSEGKAQKVEPGEWLPTCEMPRGLVRGAIVRLRDGTEGAVEQFNAWFAQVGGKSYPAADIDLKPQFKLGDKVRVSTNCWDACDGEIGTIHALPDFGDDDYEVNVNGGIEYVRAKSLELYTEPKAGATPTFQYWQSKVTGRLAEINDFTPTQADRKNWLKITIEPA